MREQYQRAYRQCRLHRNEGLITEQARQSYRALLDFTIEQCWHMYRADVKRPDIATSRQWHADRMAIIARYRLPGSECSGDYAVEHVLKSLNAEVKP